MACFRRPGRCRCSRCAASSSGGRARCSRCQRADAAAVAVAVAAAATRTGRAAQGCGRVRVGGLGVVEQLCPLGPRAPRPAVGHWHGHVRSQLTRWQVPRNSPAYYGCAAANRLHADRLCAVAKKREPKRILPAPRVERGISPCTADKQYKWSALTTAPYGHNTAGRSLFSLLQVRTASRVSAARARARVSLANT